MDALDRLISLRVGIGDRVVVEDPTFAPILDLLERVGAEVVGVPVDDRGIDPGALSDALDLHPGLVIVQPRAHNPTGATWDAPRVRDLASVLDGTGVLVVEDDHSADVAGATLLSLAAFFPDRVVHVRSFSKAYGPDLRLAAVAGPASVVDELVHRRQLGPAWSSRLLQAVLLHLLTAADAQSTIDEATVQYAARRRALQNALGDQGIEIADGCGFNLWMPVRSERTALVGLASVGIGAAPGSSFQVESSTSEYLRLTVSGVTEGFEELAAHLANAAIAGAGTGVRA
jgi:DNA-binding transcriptional MocR family regulator